MRHLLCRRPFSWRTIQQLEVRSRTELCCSRLCWCQCEQLLDHVPVPWLTESRLSKSAANS